MAIPDKLTEYASTPQVITTDAVSEFVNSWPNDAARNVFMHSEHLIRIQVAVAAAGMAEGITFEYRFDTQADLNSGSQIVCGSTGLVLPANLSVGDVYYIAIAPRKLPSGYDFSGVYYNLHTNPASGGFAVISALVDGPERIDTVE